MAASELATAIKSYNKPVIERLLRENTPINNAAIAALNEKKKELNMYTENNRAKFLKGSIGYKLLKEHEEFVEWLESQPKIMAERAYKRRGPLSKAYARGPMGSLTGGRSSLQFRLTRRKNKRKNRRTIRK
jgi:hypothetical protein